MNNTLLELIFLSEKRKSLLLFLEENPKTMDEIRDSLGVSPVAILPQIKKLRDRNIVLKENDVYSLSPLGQSITGKMRDMVDILNVFGNNYAFWATHSIECIPSPLLNRIDELVNCTFSEPPDRTRLFDPHREFVENLKESRYINGIASIFHPMYPVLFTDFAKSGREVSLLVTESVFERVKEEFQAEFRAFLDAGTSSFYVCRENIEFAHVVTDRFLSLSLPFFDGTFDHREDVLSFDSAALRWGEDLFAYYRDMSEEITEI
ncbi:winged helix-turn-helix domain-containing protein [Methanosarcina sp. KYL-1]|uniref:helix-turn-helix transcriptional regulator n=1 Tax=Methanosarcina sp. KYL-1 TaxID=2602068 RepID=UPI002100A4E4|nr:winged helix-turn-helix domain-containing protein [Methanosarcina sp. KYL-1]MCQ1536261.1 winged helix-turn-helix domain-containing protein [Methanosarcina sp. KYL-1]